MEKIVRKYAIIYIDYDGETLDEDVRDYATKEMVKDYYQNSRGFLQWNFYLVIPSSLV